MRSDTDDIDRRGVPRRSLMLSTLTTGQPRRLAAITALDGACAQRCAHQYAAACGDVSPTIWLAISTIIGC